ncbi:MAG: ACT domain-containing protein [Methanobacteriota archaeon]
MNRGDLFERPANPMTKIFSVTLDDKPGELAKLTGALGEKGINLRATSATTLGGKGIVNVITSDEAKTRDVLRTQKFSFSEDEALVARVDDRPGALAQVAKTLGAAKVNIKAVTLLSTSGTKAELALAVDNVEKAKTIVK